MPPQSFPEAEALRAVIDELTTGRKLAEDPSRLPAAILQELALHHRDLLDAVMATMQPTERFDPAIVHLRNPDDASVAVALFRWDRGNFAPFHDHPQEADATHILKGSVVELSAVRQSPAAAWDGSLVKIESVRLQEGETVSRTEARVHQVANEAAEPAFSLHALLPATEPTNIFRVAKEDKQYRLKKVFSF